MSAKDILINVHGHTYTLYQASQEFHIPWNTIRHRYYDYQIGDNLIRPVSKMRIQLDGRMFTPQQISSRYHRNLATIYSRYYAGKRGQELVRPPQASMRPKQKRVLQKDAAQQIHFRGHSRTFRSISRAYGIPCSTLRGRFYRGDRDDNLVRPTGERLRSSRRPLYINIHGIRSTFQELGHQYGLSTNLLHDRYYRGDRDEKLVRPKRKRS